jgi:hypothetical protein
MAKQITMKPGQTATFTNDSDFAISCNTEGGFTAVTRCKSHTLKTLNGAVKWIRRQISKDLGTLEIWEG